MLFDPHHLAALAAVLRTGSFEQAAAALSVTPSAISQRIKALEERVGTALILRASPCTGTPAGLRLSKHAEDVALLEAQVGRELSLAPRDAAGRLRLAVNADSLATWFIPALAEVPDVLFELVIDDQDHSADWLRRGDVSAAVTATGKAVSGCDVHPLGALRYVACASPDYMARWFPDGPTAEALSQAPCLTFNAKDALQRTWIEAATGQKVNAPVHYLPSAHGFLDAIRCGLGWGMLPETMAKGPLRNGRVVALNAALPLDVTLDWQVSRILATALAPVTTAIRAAARTGLQQG